MINLGAFLAPLVVSVAERVLVDRWSSPRRPSTALSCCSRRSFLYRDPPRPENTKTLREVLGGAAMVLGDARFMLMIFVYSGFWILYFQNFGSVLWFLRDFIDPAPVNQAFASIGIPLQFDAEHVTVINAGTIILLQVLVSRVVQERQAAPHDGHRHRSRGAGVRLPRVRDERLDLHPRASRSSPSAR